MKIFTNLLSSLLLASWMGFLAVFSIQNIQDISLKFIIWESINIPLGVLLAFCAGGGMILGSLLPILWQRKRKARAPSRR